MRLLRGQDDRTSEQYDTHPILVVGTDRFLSGWGAAAGGKSYAAWACRPDDVSRVYQWVMNRGDMLRVRIVSGNYVPRGAKHTHIYVVDDNHPALQ